MARHVQYIDFVFDADEVLWARAYGPECTGGQNDISWGADGEVQHSVLFHFKDGTENVMPLQSRDDLRVTVLPLLTGSAPELIQEQAA